MTTLKASKKCTRCPRVEDREISIEEAVKLAGEKKPPPPQISVSVDGVELIRFDTLCAPCTEIVSRYASHIGSTQTKLSSLREHKPKVEAKS